MAHADRKKWNAKYREKPGDKSPSRIVTRYCHLALPGKALDIACGSGRNSLFMADRGFTVDAVDISRVALNRLRGKHPNINVLCRDLDTWRFPSSHYELIVNIRFLDRRLFPLMKAGLKPGGLLIFESFMNGETDKYCLKTGELLQAFPTLRVVSYEEKKISPAGRYDRLAALVAIKTDGS